MIRIDQSTRQDLHALEDPRKRMIADEHNARHTASDWDARMLRVVENRDTDAYLTIYDHFAPRLKQYLLAQRMEITRAEEIVQETMLRIWQRGHNFDPNKASLSTWVFQITRNLLIDTKRHEALWRAQELDDELHEVRSDLPWATVSIDPGTQADASLIREAIAGLPPTQSRLLRMAYLESRSHSEIADELSMPIGTVKSTIRRAFMKLRAHLRGNE